jgi:hypothetical protein
MWVHGDNIAQKMSDSGKYRDTQSRQYLAEIFEKYETWRKANEKLSGPYCTVQDKDQEVVTQRVELFNDYKDFIDQQHYAEHFDARSNLHSSVLEEFMFYLFRDLVSSISDSALIGKSHSFKDIFFQPKHYKEMLLTPCVRIEKKDHDFVIGVTIKTNMTCQDKANEESFDLDIPAVAIECKNLS